MNEKLVDQIVNAVLYEGYILYPYRASAKKNRQRFTFGRVYPEAYSVAQNGAEPCAMQTECLVEGRSPTLEVKVRFLHPMSREIGRLPFPPTKDGELEPSEMTSELRVGDKIYQTWQEAVEREVSIRPLSLSSLSEGRKRVAFEFSECRTAEPILNTEKRPVGVILRRQEAIAGLVEMTAQAVDTEVFKITVRIINRSSLLDGSGGPGCRPNAYVCFNAHHSAGRRRRFSFPDRPSCNAGGQCGRLHEYRNLADSRRRRGKKRPGRDDFVTNHSL